MGSDNSNTIVGLVGGFILGGLAIGHGSSSSDRANLRRDANMPPVIRTYERNKVDRIWVLDKKVSVPGIENYVPMDVYLKKIANEYDRKIEEAKIKKVVGW